MISIPNPTNFALVLVLLTPAAVLGVVVAAWLRRRRPAGTFVRRLNGAGVFTCGQCHATWPAASRRDGLATWRIHAATDHLHHRALARR